MPVPIELLLAFRRAIEAAQEGRVADARAEIIRFEVQLQGFAEVLTPLERLLHMAAVAQVLQDCRDFNGAAKRLEEVCELAVRLAPNSTQTYGDLYNLADCYVELGQLESALVVFERAHPICRAACPQFLPSLEARMALIRERRTNNPIGLAIEVQCTALNYSLAHAGLQPLASLTVRNPSEHPVHVSLRAGITGVTLPTEVPPFELAAGEIKECAPDVQLRFVMERLKAQSERARVSVDVHANGRLAGTCETWLLSYNECSWQRGHEAALAAFVHPNNPAIKVVGRRALRYLRELSGWSSFVDARLSDRADRTDRVVEAIHSCLSRDCDLVYDFEAPSWEEHSQRIRFPDEVMVGGVATCIDLVLLMAASLEGALVGCSSQPLLLLLGEVPQHALLGCWRDRPLAQEREGIVRDADALRAWVVSGEMLVLDATGVTDQNPIWGRRASFEESAQKGRELILGTQHVLAINLAAVRPTGANLRQGVTPLPFRTEPPFGESALRALWTARDFCRRESMKRLQSTHLLWALLELEGAATGYFLELSLKTGNQLVEPGRLRAFIATGLSQSARSSPAVVGEAEGFGQAVRSATDEARRLNSPMIEELHLLSSLLRRPGLSVSKMLRQRKTSPEECLAFLELLHPPPTTELRSEFPSEVVES